MIEIQTRPLYEPQLTDFDDQNISRARLLIDHKDYELALGLLRHQSSKDSKDFEVLSLMSEALEKTGRLAECLKVKEVLKSTHPCFETCLSWAHGLYQTGRDEEALKAYFECLSLIENESAGLFEIYKNMGNLSVKLGDFDGAEEFYNKAYVIDSNSDVLLVNFGTLEVQRGDFNKALFCFREALAINPKNDKAWVGLALMHNEFGDHDLAWANLTAALDLEATNRTAVLLCARWALRDKKENLAIQPIENFLYHEPFDEDISLLLIHLYCRMNLFRAAALEVTKILAWNPNLQAAQEVQKQLQALGENR